MRRDAAAAAAAGGERGTEKRLAGCHNGLLLSGRHGDFYQQPLIMCKPVQDL